MNLAGQGLTTLKDEYRLMMDPCGGYEEDLFFISYAVQMFIYYSLSWREAPGLAVVFW